MDISKYEIFRLMEDEIQTGEVIIRAVNDPDVLAKLASEVADEIADTLEDDPQYKERIIHAATESLNFKQRIVKEIVDELS